MATSTSLQTGGVHLNGVALTDANGVLGAYPIGSIYLSVNNTSPASLFGGSWEKIKENAIIPLGSNAPVIGNGMTMGITNSSYNGGLFSQGSNPSLMVKTSYYGSGVGTGAEGSANTLIGQTMGLSTDPNRSGVVALLSQAASQINGVNIWKRIS